MVRKDKVSNEPGLHTRQLTIAIGLQIFRQVKTDRSDCAYETRQEL